MDNPLVTPESLSDILKACDVPARKIAAITKEKATAAALTSILQGLNVVSSATSDHPKSKPTLSLLLRLQANFLPMPPMHASSFSATLRLAS